jgi:site-specific recombinase XerC
MSDLRFAQAVESYRLYCRARGLAPRTLETYFFALEALHSFLASDQSAPPIPSSHELRAFIAHMLDLNLSRGTIRIRMRAVRAFCGFLVREQLVKANPFAGVDIPRVPTAYPAVLSVEDVQRLVGASRGGSWMQVRNHAIILTLLDTGIRLGELLRLNWEDVDLGGFAIRIRHGKGEKERHVFMGRCLHRALRRWLDLRGVALQQGPLYVTRPGVRLEKRIVQRIVARTAEGSVTHWHQRSPAPAPTHVCHPLHHERRRSVLPPAHSRPLRHQDNDDIRQPGRGRTERGPCEGESGGSTHGWQVEEGAHSVVGLPVASRPVSAYTGPLKGEARWEGVSRPAGRLPHSGLHPLSAISVPPPGVFPVCLYALLQYWEARDVE